MILIADQSDNFTIPKRIIPHYLLMIRNILRQTPDANDWGYDPSNGPHTWYKKWPVAMEGRNQSPVILSSVALEDSSLNQPRLMVDLS